jgi:hypothetical protein
VHENALGSLPPEKSHYWSLPGMPDGLFSNQKSQFGKILDGLVMENVGVFYVHLVYFTSFGNILCPFGIFCGHLVYFVVISYSFPHFGMLY